MIDVGSVIMKLSEEPNVTAEVAWFVSCDFFTGDYHVPQRSDLGCSQNKTKVHTLACSHLSVVLAETSKLKLLR